MAAQGFPVMNLTSVVFEKVLKFCPIEDLLLVATLSRKTKRILQEARVWQIKFVNVRFDNFYVKLQNYNGFSWRFVAGQNIDWTPTFLELIDRARNHGTYFVCANPKTTLYMAFGNIMKLLKIEHIHDLGVSVTREYHSLQSNDILKNVKSCDALELSLNHSVSNQDLDWLFQRLTVRNKFAISATRAGLYQYDKPFSTVENVYYDGWLNPHTFEYKTLVNATHIYMFNGTGRAQLNPFFKAWQQGLLPKLQIIEHGGIRTVVSPGYRDYVLNGLDARDWDISREETFNQNGFYLYAKLKYFTRSLRFRDAKDITRTTDGVKASFIPADQRPGNFVFVVWSDWIPSQYRRPSKTPYVPER